MPELLGVLKVEPEYTMDSRSTPFSPPSSRTRDPRPRRNMRSCEEIIEGTSSFSESNQNQTKFCHDRGSGLGIGTAELGVRMQEGTLGRDLWNKLGDVNNATDNG